MLNDISMLIILSAQTVFVPVYVVTLFYQVFIWVRTFRLNKS